MPPVAELSARARQVFRLVVEGYLDSGMPVGSRTIAQLGGLNLSPASIRNVMQDLEERGLLAAPHASAGRMPTEGGLRLFVDAMMQATEPSDLERAAIEAQARGPIEEALVATSQVLSGLSACAGIVLVPRREPVLRQFSFVPLNGGQAVAVLVGADGSVENRVVDIPADVVLGALDEAGNYISARLAGLTLPQAQARLIDEIAQGRVALDEAARGLVARGLALWSEDGAHRPVMIVRGQANLIDATAAADLERVRQLLDEIEGKEEIARLLESARGARAMKIFIGSENKLFALSGSSVIAAPYHDAAGRVVGVVGVIGPTRLNYARVVPMVEFTAQTLTRWMA
ncbi:heat-inducible transcriptional repressor HrcA [Sphingomonas nostoxanthinifaciens]|uniref:heat-inducible transcriptional repressor HrcA n=1 Tax=Sphingomonas nostoxanthinifaciens TaxID=2872652 RepID=UPI001CC1E76F|nr:heat-inducible transcriptional repressor HrcA [Sphingomonas nostoxanthinifaciens]UAK26223.1 heat-inducible transcriptional repressor HrcA [Sphingomonas nostoxanthinifaciens]